MKKTLSLLAVLIATGVAATPVQAANHYVSALAGVSWMQDNDVTYANDWVSNTDRWHNTFDSGITGVVAIGCDYGSTRLEAEAGYQRNDFREAGFPYDLTDDWGRSSLTGGKSTVYSLMANGFYDIPLGGGAELYGMAGLGVAQINLEGNYAINFFEGESINGDPFQDDRVTAEDMTYKAHTTAFAYQLGAGVTIPLSKGVVLDARYRYFATADFTVTGPVESTWFVDGNDDFQTAYTNNSLNTHISSHSVLVGLRVDI